MMNVAVAKTSAGHPLNEAFALARGRLPGSGQVASERQRAIEAFEKQGLPYRRVEDWKYTDLRVLMREVAPLAASPDQAALARAGSAIKEQIKNEARRLVLVDGVFVPQLSDLDDVPAGLRIRTLRDVLEADDEALRSRILPTGLFRDSMIALNAAMMTDGVVITVDDGVELTRPLHIIHVASASEAAMFTRSLLLVGDRAKATLVEGFIAAEGARTYQAHDTLIVAVGNHSRLDHVRAMEDARDAVNISSAFVTLGSHSHVNMFNMTIGGGVSRYQGFFRLNGSHSQVEADGVNLLNGTQHGDTTLVLDHAVPHCNSREEFRAVLDDRAKSVFQGRINVHQPAQKTDAKMMTRALLLSDESEAYNKPELEIFADDVVCGHGATTGALDEELIFYLRARGLDEKEAQSLLIAAFVGEAIISIVDDDLRELAIASVDRWLAARE